LVPAARSNKHRWVVRRFGGVAVASGVQLRSRWSAAAARRSPFEAKADVMCWPRVLRSWPQPTSGGS